MSKIKIFILLPDGVGLRNFAYTNFYKIGKELDFDITYWNNTPFNLTTIGFKEIEVGKSKSHILTEILKNAKKHIELNLFSVKFQDLTYDSYRFPFSNKSLKNKLKTFITKRVIRYCNSEIRLKKLNRKIISLEKKTTYFATCLENLKVEKPAFVFCTNQRHISAIAPIEAAKELGIPTGTFIFSWDNLPKATLVLDTDYYFVWSNLMKEELQKYYPHIKNEQIFITGTPQFESHYNSRAILPKDVFYHENNLDFSKEYLCFSGDDETTSPDDPNYLEDFAKAILKLNRKGNNLGIIFRRCPVDFSKRYDTIIEKYKEIIVEIKPRWEVVGDSWNAVLPTIEDVVLLSNSIYHSKLVVNLGSSMVFDYAAFNKPCAYFNYNQPLQKNTDWDIFKCYKYIHFRSMPTKEAVVWMNSAEDIEYKINLLLSEPENTVLNAQKWFEIINCSPPELASQRIWENIARIVK